jgi:hypothetical protein
VQSAGPLYWAYLFIGATQGSTPPEGYSERDRTALLDALAICISNCDNPVLQEEIETFDLNADTDEE